MKNILVIFLSFFSAYTIAQHAPHEAIQEVKVFQKELNDEYKNAETSPLNSKDLMKFKEHKFFPIDLKYRVTAKLIETPNSPVIDFKTTTSKLKNYRIYGYVEFILMDKPFRVPVYQSQDLMKNEKYVDYLFFPFTDLTNGEETYGGGRYIDLRIPQGEELVIDFNKAYNPYCAYSSKYSCPLVPAENRINLPILAGVMYKKKK